MRVMTIASTPHAPVLSREIAEARNDILNVAAHMIAVGSVTVLDPRRPESPERCVVVRDHDQPGCVVILLSVVDGEPSLRTIDFDMADSSALHHLPHRDGLGLTVTGPNHEPVLTYRVG